MLINKLPAKNANPEVIHCDFFEKEIDTDTDVAGVPDRLESEYESSSESESDPGNITVSDSSPDGSVQRDRVHLLSR